MSDPTNDELIAAAYCALNAHNFSEYIQEHTMFFGASKSEVDSILLYANIIKTLKNLGYKDVKNHELVKIFNCIWVINKQRK